jgi:hypothetical protein
MESQLHHKPSPLLYDLAAAFLKRMETTQNPKALYLSFLLKLLKHEGLFCHTISAEGLKESALTRVLAESRKFHEIEETQVDNELEKMVCSLFARSI